jgi:hypothetical protein
VILWTVEDVPIPALLAREELGPDAILIDDNVVLKSWQALIIRLLPAPIPTLRAGRDHFEKNDRVALIAAL